MNFSSFRRRGDYQSRNSPQKSLFLEEDHESLYGLIPVYLALYSARRQVSELIIQEGLDQSNKKDEVKASAILDICARRKIPIQSLPKHDLNMISENRPHQGFVLRAQPLDIPTISRLSPTLQYRCALALDEITDPQNLGSILRSAFYFGVQEVIVCSKNSSPLSPVVSKASAGALEVMNIHSANNMMKFLDDSKQNGWQVVGTSLGDDSVTLEALPLSKPTILIMGNEGHGLRSNILARCDHRVTIPCGRRSNALVDSLNVSVATGILLNHLQGGQEREE